MNWIVLLVVSISGAAIFLWSAIIKCSDFCLAAFAFSFSAAAISLIVTLAFGIQAPRNVDGYINQKAYIENYEAKAPIEDASLTAKKIELNGWLYSAQYSKSRFGGWSFYPDSILELEPIK